jgi:hypothetical protein
MFKNSIIENMLLRKKLEKLQQRIDELENNPKLFVIPTLEQHTEPDNICEDNIVEDNIVEEKSDSEEDEPIELEEEEHKDEIHDVYQHEEQITFINPMTRKPKTPEPIPEPKSTPEQPQNKTTKKYRCLQCGYNFNCIRCKKRNTNK